VNVVRSHAARRNTRADHDDEAIGRVPAHGDLESAVVRRRMIDQALARLPPDLRLLITLRDVQGLEYREIAVITGLPIGTVESRIFRGRRRLRPMLEPLLARSAPRREN
jgi:RNA polymerase sigma factor (sigma-70 family)